MYVAGLCMAFRRDILGASKHLGSRNPGMGCNDVRLVYVECSYAVQVYRARPSRMNLEWRKLPMSQSFVLPGPDLVRRRVLTPVALEFPKRLCTRLMVSG